MLSIRIFAYTVPAFVTIASASVVAQGESAIEEQRHYRNASIQRDCACATYADEPSIADLFANSELVVVGSGEVRMLLRESPFATGTDWDGEKYVVDIRVAYVVKGRSPMPSIPVVFVETRKQPMTFGPMEAEWRQRAILFLKSANRDGYWELTCKEPIHIDAFPGIPTCDAEPTHWAEADSPQEALLNLLILNVERGSLESSWQSAKALRDFGALDGVEDLLKQRLRRTLITEYQDTYNAGRFLRNVICFNPGLVKQVLVQSWDDLPKDAVPLIERNGRYLPGPIPEIADAMFEKLVSATSGKHADALDTLAAHIVPEQTDRLVKLFPRLSPWDKGAASFALVKVLDERTLPQYLSNFRAEQSLMQRYLALRTINTRSGTIDPAILKYRKPIVDVIMEWMARHRAIITDYPSSGLPRAAWRLLEDDPTLPALTNDVEKDADALLEWWLEAEERY